MTIKLLKNELGASRFGSCNECGKGTDEEHNMIRINLRDHAICLCPKCFMRLTVNMNIFCYGLAEKGADNDTSTEKS